MISAAVEQRSDRPDPVSTDWWDLRHGLSALPGRSLSQPASRSKDRQCPTGFEAFSYARLVGALDSIRRTVGEHCLIITRGLLPALRRRNDMRPPATTRSKQGRRLSKPKAGTSKNGNLGESAAACPREMTARTKSLRLRREQLSRVLIMGHKLHPCAYIVSGSGCGA